MINETNVKIVGYQKTRPEEKSEKEEECSDEEKMGKTQSAPQQNN